MKKSALSALCLAWILAGVPARTQQQKPSPSQEPPVFGETVEVRVVNVEVVITDKDGNRVTGLKPGDFKLKVDGKDVPVTYFTEVAGGQSVAPPAAAEGAPAAVAVPGMEPGGAVGTSYLVFIDEYFSTETRRNEVLKSLQGDLARLGPGDRMAIVAYDGGRLAIVSGWSQSQSELARAFDQAMTRPARGLDRIAEFNSFQHDQTFARGTVGDNAPLSITSRMDSSGLNLPERAYGETLFRQEEGVVNAAARTLRTFASSPGRKVLLLLAGGWPYSIQSYIRGGAAMPAARELKDGDQLLRKLTSTANLLGFTVYPVDVPGVQSAGDPSITEAGGSYLDQGIEAPARAGAFRDQEAKRASGSANGSFRDQEIKGTLEFVAQETGGKPLRNDNRLVALTTAVADTRSYYWLGFSPTWERNDASHKIAVTLARAGLKVRSRTDFLDLSKKAEVSMLAESSLLFGNLPGGLTLPMRVGTPVRTRAGVEIPVTLGLPSDVVTLVPVGNKYAAHAELRFAATDNSGNDSKIPVAPLDITSEKPAKPGGFIKYETKITLKGKANRLVATVYDPISGKIATAETSLTLP
ncbi:MAG TPA: VWA domain-containing protein [Thermoanaerobaculia bacterium]|nr:VWA domain-containing protein [Thermoanaerobaculia bacterium]